ncbi:hypothetical protein CAXC1_310030 [Candidatus Xenohaliotis californiensis]|uniref:Uncharacterized protein n=1 Tax=Candidatus Xenohaliotis californiensis TaxID=84677 RepID=A0ABM9N8G4_9RICK|nr:hypothetical protein CAXC1_310030 [Candidatus Xenohaliotis californiensis]
MISVIFRMQQSLAWYAVTRIPPEYQQGAYPTQGYQQGAYPTQGYQQGTYPTQGYQQGAYPTQGYQQDAYSAQYWKNQIPRCLGNGVPNYYDAATMIHLYTGIPLINMINPNYRDQSVVDIDLNILNPKQIASLSFFEKILLAENGTRNIGDYFSSIENHRDNVITFQIAPDILSDIAAKNRIMYAASTDQKVKNMAVSNIKNVKEPFRGNKAVKVVAGGVGIGIFVPGTVAMGSLLAVSIGAASAAASAASTFLLIFGLPALLCLGLSIGSIALLKSGLGKSAQVKTNENNDITKLDKVNDNLNHNRLQNTTVDKVCTRLVQNKFNREVDSANRDKDLTVSSNAVSSDELSMQNAAYEQSKLNKK